MNIKEIARLLELFRALPKKKQLEYCYMSAGMRLLADKTTIRRK